MALKRRERLLSWGAGSVVTIALLQVSYNYVAAMFTERRTRIEALNKEIDDKDKAVLAGRKAQKKLTEWRERSLPTDSIMARALYKNWLASIVEDTGIKKADITLGADLPKPDIYTKTPVNVRGQGDMEQVIRLLFAFYQANHLHQIRTLTLTPIARPVEPVGEEGGEAGGPPRRGPGMGWPGMRGGWPGGGGGGKGGGGKGGGGMGRDWAGGGPFGGGSPAGATSATTSTGEGTPPWMAGGMAGGRFGDRPKKVGKDDGLNYDITLAIDALSLAGGDRADRLAIGEAKRLAFDDADRYVKAITERSLFTPPLPDVEPGSDMFVTAVVKKEGKYQVWMNVRSSGDTLKLSEGDTFDLGDQKATIASIEPHAIKIKTAGKTRLVNLGKSLAEERRRRGFGGGGMGWPQ